MARRRDVAPELQIRTEADVSFIIRIIHWCYGHWPHHHALSSGAVAQCFRSAGELLPVLRCC